MEICCGAHESAMVRSSPEHFRRYVCSLVKADHAASLVQLNFEDGAAVLQKPFSIEALSRCIHAVVQGDFANYEDVPRHLRSAS